MDSRAAQAEQLLNKLFEQEVQLGNRNVNQMPLFELLQELSKAHGVAFGIDKDSFRAEGDLNITDRKPSAAGQLRELSLHQFLIRVLDSLGATYLINGGGLEIVTCAHAAKTSDATLDEEKGHKSLVHPLVSAVISNKPLVDVVEMLSSRYDLNIVLPPQGDSSASLVSAHLLNVPADRALDLLAGQCDLRAVRDGNVFLLTSAKRVSNVSDERSLAEDTISRACGDGDRMTKSHPGFKPTVGIITALPHEFAAIECLLSNSRPHQIPGAGAAGRYQFGEVLTTSGRAHSIVLTLLPDTGNNMAASQAAHLQSHFPVGAVIMTGIAGGVPHPDNSEHHVRLGDIVVSDRGGVVQYDFVKRERGEGVGEELRASPRPPSAELLQAVRYLDAAAFRQPKPWYPLIDRVVNTLGFTRPDDATDILYHSLNREQLVAHPVDSARDPNRPRLFKGAIAAANTLLKDPVKRDELRTRHKAKAVEMEGAGIADATWHADSGYLVVRGVCDYCDMSKGDAWQKYAAAVAAGYTVALIASIPFVTD